MTAEYPPDGLDPARFELYREGELIALGCSFPFPHDAIVVSQTDTTVAVDDLAAARRCVGADSLRFLDTGSTIPVTVDPLPDP